MLACVGDAALLLPDKPKANQCKTLRHTSKEGTMCSVLSRHLRGDGWYLKLCGTGLAVLTHKTKKDHSPPLGVNTQRAEFHSLCRSSRTLQFIVRRAWGRQVPAIDTCTRPLPNHSWFFPLSSPSSCFPLPEWSRLTLPTGMNANR